MYNDPIVRSGLLRTYHGSIFSYFGCGYENGFSSFGDEVSSRRDADYRKPWSSRAVVVVGAGI